MHQKAVSKNTLLFFSLAFLSGCSALEGGYEQPQYDKLVAEGPAEIRRYAALSAVSSRGGDENSAFRVLFRYISGENAAAEKISMTVPVRRAGKKGGDLSFFAPSRYSGDTLPKPSDERVSISQFPAGRYAVLRFSGTTSESRVAAKLTELRNWIMAKGLAENEPAVWYLDRYDPPWTPWFLRTNEVLVRLTD